MKNHECAVKMSVAAYVMHDKGSSIQFGYDVHCSHTMPSRTQLLRTSGAEEYAASRADIFFARLCG